MKNILYIIFFTLIYNCKTRKVETKTGLEVIFECKNLKLDEKKYNSTDAIKIYEIIVTEYFDLGNIYLQNEKDGIYDPTFIEFTTLQDIEKYYQKEKLRLSNVNKLKIEGIDEYFKQKEHLLNVRNNLYKLIKKSFNNPQILKSDTLTSHNKDLPIIFETRKRKIDSFFKDYFKKKNEYYGKIYLKNRPKERNKITDIIIFDIFHSKILELNEKERELNKSFYKNYKKIYECKD